MRRIEVLPLFHTRPRVHWRQRRGTRFLFFSGSTSAAPSASEKRLDFCQSPSLGAESGARFRVQLCARHADMSASWTTSTWATTPGMLWRSSPAESREFAARVRQFPLTYPDGPAARGLDSKRTKDCAARHSKVRELWMGSMTIGAETRRPPDSFFGAIQRQSSRALQLPLHAPSGIPCLAPRLPAPASKLPSTSGTHAGANRETPPGRITCSERMLD